jgi:hypothetical protein
MQNLDPGVVILLVLVTASASLAHVLWGKRWRQIPVFWLAGALGAIIAYLSGYQFPLELPMPGGVAVLEVVLAAWICIIIASRLRV